MGLVKFYWDHQRCVAKSGKYHGDIFVPYRGATQGGVVSPTFFNVLVDAVVQKWLADVMEDMTATLAGLQGNDVSRMLSLFYDNNGAIGSLDHEWLQYANQHLYNLFRGYTGLVPNTEKTETMSCYPGTFRGRCLEEGYKHQHEGTRDTYAKRKGKELCVRFPFVVKTWH